MTFRREAIARVHRPGPVGSSGYPAYRNCLRLEFAYRCIYCGSHEREVAAGDSCGGFEIDHFRPQSRFPRLGAAYVNLMWSCKRCNRAKGGRWPTQDNFISGDRFVDPNQEAMSDHLGVQGDRVVPVRGSRAGAYTLQELNLNSDVHLNRRRDRAKAEPNARLLTQFLAQLQTELAHRDASDERRAELLASCASVEAELLPYLRRGDPPWDAVDTCLCASSSLGSATTSSPV